MNRFNFSSRSNASLSRNPAHNFAMNHGMMIYKSNAMYTFIPKNACSTMRLSIAIANGCINGIEEGHWIHGNNQTFTPSLSEAIKSEYSFTILRCPFRRLASVYLDKFVSKEPEAWQYRNATNRNLNLDNLTFQQFVMSLDKPYKLNMDIHWKPQVSFLLFKEYSDYFCLEDFSRCMEKLKEKINFTVVDARSLTNHSTNQYTLSDDENYSNTAAFDIAVMKREGKCPSHSSLYNDELYQYVSQIYSEDISFYTHKFGKENLLSVIE